jgi:hypothetical protein
LIYIQSIVYVVVPFNCGAGIINIDFYTSQIIWEFLSGKSYSGRYLTKNELFNITLIPNTINSYLRIGK